MEAGVIRGLSPSLAEDVGAEAVIGSLTDAVLRLVDNALEAAATAVAVRLRLQDAAKLRVTVVDNGTGIPLPHMARLGHRHESGKGKRGESLWALGRVCAWVKVETEHSPDLCSWTKRCRHRHILPGRIEEKRRHCPGTTVTLGGLFHYLPVRRTDFDEDWEMEHLVGVLTSYAVFNPKVSLTLRCERTGRLKVRALPSAGAWDSFQRFFAALFPHSLHHLPTIVIRGDAVQPSGEKMGEMSVALFVGSVGFHSQVLQMVGVNGRGVEGRRIRALVESKMRGSKVTKPKECRRAKDARDIYSSAPTTLHLVFVCEITCSPELVEIDCLSGDMPEATFRWRKEVEGEVERSLGEWLRTEDLLLEAETDAVAPRPLPAHPHVQIQSHPAHASEAVNNPSSVLSLLIQWDSDAFAGAVEAKAAGALDPVPSLPERLRLDPSLLRRAEVVGQFGQGFIVLKWAWEGKTMLGLVDQHAAHERILLERLIREAEDPRHKVWRTHKLSPDRIFLHEFDNAALDSLLKHASRLRRWGVVVEREAGVLVVSGVPAVLLEKESRDRALFRFSQLTKDLRAILRGFLLDLWSGRGYSHLPPKALRDVLNQLACKSEAREAVKVGDALGGGGMRRLVRELWECECPWACAHGRPTTLPLVSLPQALPPLPPFPLITPASQ